MSHMPELEFVIHLLAAIFAAATAAIIVASTLHEKD